MLLLAKNSRGSILFVLVISALFLTLIIEGLRISLSLQKRAQTTTNRLAADQLRETIEKLFVQTSLCSCHFDPMLNTADSATTKVDTVTMPTPDLRLTSLRSGCSFAGADNIVATTGNRLSNGLTVNDIAIKNLKLLNAGILYSGELTVQISNAAGEFSLKPVSIPIKFAIDNVSGSPGARQIAACLPSSASLVYACPSGFSLVGRPGIRGTICMESNIRGATNYFNAKANCTSLQDPNLGLAQLCSDTPLTTACKRGGGPTGFGPWEWSWSITFPGSSATSYIDSTAFGVAIDGSCSLAFLDVNSTRNYRCCFQAM